MSLNTIKFLGITITTNSKKEILEYVRKYLDEKEKGKRKKEKLMVKPLIIVTPNPEQVVLAETDKRFAQILNQADVALPDGVGLVFAWRVLQGKRQKEKGKRVLQRIPGIECMEDLTEMAQKEGVKVGLIGGRGGVAVEALECLKKRYPGLSGWAEEPEEIKLDQLDELDTYVSTIKDKIILTGTRLVFVGLGAPKQEYFIEAISYQLSAISRKASIESRQLSESLKAESWKLKAPVILMSVGGSFDILAGRVTRAPFIIRHIGLEWIWRLVHEPWRWKRQKALMRFIWLVLRDWLSKRAR